MSGKNQAVLENADDANTASSKIRDVREESNKLTTIAIQRSRVEKDSEKDLEIEEITAPKGEAYHCDILIAHIDTLLVLDQNPVVSRFLPNCLHLYHITHIMDDLLCSNRNFYQSTRQWCPLISRYYFGVLYVIQVLRAMDESDQLDHDSRIFLQQFLNKFPPQSLPIPGPLMTFYQAICVSECQYSSFGLIAPMFVHPNQLHPRDVNGLPSFHYVNFLQPNIPGIVSLINQIGSVERIGQFQSNTAVVPFNPLQNIPNGPNRESRPTLAGVEFPANILESGGNLRWYFTSPGLEHPVEAGNDILKNFSQEAYKYGFHQIRASDRFGDLRKYLFLERPKTFSTVLSVMSKVIKHFRFSSHLGNCPPRGIQAGQIICTMNPPEPLTPVNVFGDENLIEHAFEAETCNPTIGQLHQKYAFASKIHTVFSHVERSTHPLNGVGTTEHVEMLRSGPFWNSSSLRMSSSTDFGYLRYPELIRTKYYLEKPEN